MDANPKLQAVLEAVAAGRTKGHTCPFCEKATLNLEQGDYGPELTCPACKKFIELPMTDY